MTVEERLVRAERRLVWVLLVAGVSLVVGILSILLTQSARVQHTGAIAKELRAKSFILEDDNGKTRATLSTNKDESGLTLCDETGTVRAGLGVGKNGVGLRLADESSKDRIALGLGKEGPGLLLYDQKGKVVWKAP